jgi:hypothetical protein
VTVGAINDEAVPDHAITMGDGVPTMTVMTLYPYFYQDICWVFDDPQTGLKEEAFVLGASEMISRLLSEKEIPDAEHGFALSFSDQPFEHDVKLTWLPISASRTSNRPAD